MTENANRCVYCGSALSSEAIVCDTCGKPVSTPQPPQPAPLPFTPPFLSDPAGPPAAQPLALRRITRSVRTSAPPPAQPIQTPVQPVQPATQPVAPRQKSGPALPLILGAVGCLALVCVGILAAGGLLFVRARDSGMSLIPQFASTQPAEPDATRAPSDQPAPTGQPAPTEAAQAAPAAPSTGSAAHEGTWSDDIGQQLTDTYFAENFSNSDYGWAEADDETRSWAYEDQRYALHIKQTDYVAWAYLPVDFTPLEVGFDAVLPLGFEQGAFGVLCHYQDQDNYHYVAIDPVNQEFAIGKFIDNEDTMLQADWWLPAQHLQKSANAVNRVKVICRLDKISLYINDQLESEVTIQPAFPGRMAVYAETWEDMPAEGFKVLFDNLYANLQEP